MQEIPILLPNLPADVKLTINHFTKAGDTRTIINCLKRQHARFFLSKFCFILLKIWQKVDHFSSQLSNTNMNSVWVSSKNFFKITRLLIRRTRRRMSELQVFSDLYIQSLFCCSAEKKSLFWLIVECVLLLKFVSYFYQIATVLTYKEGTTAHCVVVR